MNEYELKPERVLDVLNKGDFGDGDLTLIIACTKCDANFEINREAITVAIMGNTTFIDFMIAVQHEKCSECNNYEKKEK